MSKRILTILLLLSVAINLGVIGALGFRSWRPPRHGDRLPGKPRPKGHPEYAALNLTDQQSRLWSQAEKEILGRLDELRNQLHTEHQLLFDQLQADKPDRQIVQQQIERIGALHQNMQTIVMDGLLEKRSFLNDQQWKQLLGLIGGHMPGVECGGRKEKEQKRGPKSGPPMKRSVTDDESQPAVPR
jgi:Spy/CpxP family protein refolding chaperone